MMVNLNGPWVVTTEGDEEGRTTERLGIWSGPLDRIALGLADRAFYALTFEPLKVGDGNSLPIRKREVYVHNYSVGAPLAELLKDRPVSLSKGNFYDSTRIVSGLMYEPEIEASLAQAARSKLTDGELKALTKAIKQDARDES